MTISDTTLSEAQVLEVSYSVLARKLRGELMLGLLEDFAAGRCTARSMIEQFRLAEQALTGELPGLASRTGQALRTLVTGQRDATGQRPERWTARAREWAMGRAPEWERLRQVGRDRGRPVSAWEIFHGLHAISRRYPDPMPDAPEVTIGAIEAAMALDHHALPRTWSLSQYLREVRQRCGPEFTPAPPYTVAAMLLRVDASRQLIKPGAFDIGIRPTPFPGRSSLTPSTMNELVSQVQASLAKRLTGSASIELLSGPAEVRGQSPHRSDVQHALHAGQAIVRAERAQELAVAARERARELRARRLTSLSTPMQGAAAAVGVGGLGMILLGSSTASPKVQLLGVLGLCMSSANYVAGTIKDWAASTEALASPFRAWMAERIAELAQHSAESRLDTLNRAEPSEPVSRRVRVAAADRVVQRALRKNPSPPPPKKLVEPPLGGIPGVRPGPPPQPGRGARRH
jgi:hypothetical protein